MGSLVVAKTVPDEADHPCSMYRVVYRIYTEFKRNPKPTETPIFRSQ